MLEAVELLELATIALTCREAGDPTSDDRRLQVDLAGTLPPLDDIVHTVRRRLACEAMERTGRNQRQSALMLGISPTRFWHLWHSVDDAT